MQATDGDKTWDETHISDAIIRAYHERLRGCVVSDVVIVGAGPSGLVAAWRLAEAGSRVTVIEKRLTPGGGVWGGAMGMNCIVIQEAARPLLEELDLRYESANKGLFVVDAALLASALTLRALRAGAVLFNLTAFEDVCLHNDTVSGIVINRTMLSPALPIDPLVLRAAAVIDATGHDAAVVTSLRRRGLLDDATAGEGPLDAAAGERFVVDNTGELYPHLWVCGMTVCTALHGPRMGPIFGGMLLSGQRVASLVAAELAPSAKTRPSLRREASTP